MALFYGLCLFAAVFSVAAEKKAAVKEQIHNPKGNLFKSSE